jgi:hypothetical protein
MTTRHVGKIALMAFALTSLGTAARAQDPRPVPSRIAQEARRYEGPSVTLQNLLQEALEKNPELVALRDQIVVAQQVQAVR